MLVMAQEYDNYNDDNKYSQYPTEENKYECRTGPFEGFFVSSVEFCKHVKFDNDKMIEKITEIEIIEQDLQGPPGPQGHLATRPTRFTRVHKVDTNGTQVHQELMEHKVDQEKMEPKLTHV